LKCAVTEIGSIEVKAIGPQVHYFEFDDSGAGWQIKIAPGKAATILLGRSRMLHHAGWMQPMHFYVPKGAKELQCYWAGGPHWMHGPDGKKLKEIETSGAFVRVGSAGRRRRQDVALSRMALGQLWFFNAPNCLAASPSALMLPRELATKDGLKAPRRTTNRVATWLQLVVVSKPPGPDLASVPPAARASLLARRKLTWVLFCATVRSQPRKEPPDLSLHVFFWIVPHSSTASRSVESGERDCDRFCWYNLLLNVF